MATRQYIGARYVPKFADPIAWNKANSYEALTIVTYLNNSYTSKKAVPANTEITNTEYWVVTGNYNAQVEEYRKVTVKVAEDLAKEIEDRETNETSIKADVNIPLSAYNRNRKLIILSDSYGSRWGTDGNTLPQIIANYLGVVSGNLYNGQRDSIGFTDYNTGITFRGTGHICCRL